MQKPPRAFRLATAQYRMLRARQQGQRQSALVIQAGEAIARHLDDLCTFKGSRLHANALAAIEQAIQEAESARAYMNAAPTPEE